MGLLAGGLVIGLLAGSLGGVVQTSMPSGVRIGASAVGALALIAIEWSGRHALLPQHGRVVPQQITRRASPEGALQFGFELGLGFRTLLTSGLPYAVLLLVVTHGSVPRGLLAGAGFALGRGLLPLLQAGWTEDKWEAARLRQWGVVRVLSWLTMLVSAAIVIIPV